MYKCSLRLEWRSFVEEELWQGDVLQKAAGVVLVVLSCRYSEGLGGSPGDTAASMGFGVVDIVPFGCRTWQCVLLGRKRIIRGFHRFYVG